jgi:hypothetical protein
MIDKLGTTKTLTLTMIYGIAAGILIGVTGIALAHHLWFR